MKKIDSRGFVLAETLVVAVFLMAIFTLIFSNFYPLMGEYEKRETYDDVDGKYAVYWLKKMIEDSSYQITGNTESFFRSNGYVRFECKDILSDNEKRDTCIHLVRALEVEGCDGEGNKCEIYITNYKIGPSSDSSSFKGQVADNTKLKYQINNNTEANYIAKCEKFSTIEEASEKTKKCTKEANSKAFRNGFKEYIDSLPDYKVESLDGVNYRVIASFHHKKDNNNYYSYSTIEVNR